MATESVESVFLSNALNGTAKSCIIVKKSWDLKRLM